MGIGLQFYGRFCPIFSPANAHNRCWTRRRVESPSMRELRLFLLIFAALLALAGGATAGVSDPSRRLDRGLKTRTERPCLLHDGLFGERRSLGFARDDGEKGVFLSGPGLGGFVDS